MPEEMTKKEDKTSRTNHERGLKIRTSQILHVSRLHINNIETLIANFQVPKVYA